MVLTRAGRPFQKEYCPPRYHDVCSPILLREKNACLKIFYYDLWILAFIHKGQHKLVLTHGSSYQFCGNSTLYQFCGELDPHIWVVDISKPRSPYHSKTNPDSSLALRFSSAGRDEGTLTAFILCSLSCWRP